MNDNTHSWILNVCDHIEANIHEAISLESLSKISTYSPRHFQRLFKEVCAESIMEYVRGRRLTVAMERLVSTDDRIIDIALDYQFESQEAFTRSFCARFGFPPQRFKSHKVTNSPSRKRPIDKSFIDFLNNEDFTREPTIDCLPVQRFFGVSTKVDINSFGTPALQGTIGALIAKFRESFASSQADHAVSAQDKQLYLISYREPPEVRESDDGIRIFAGHALKENQSVPGALESIDCPQSTYASFTYKGTGEQLNNAIYYVTSTWIPRSRYRIGSAPVLFAISADGTSTVNKVFKVNFPLRARNPRTLDHWW